MKQQNQILFWLAFGLLVCSIAFAFAIVYQFYISAIILLAGLIAELFCFSELMKKKDRLIRQFIWSVRYSEFLFAGSSPKTTSEKYPYEWENAMQEALFQYKKNIQQKESQLQYFQALANHIDLAILVFSPSEKIEWMNLAAQQQTGLKYPQTIDELHLFHPELPARLRTLRPGEISILQTSKGEEAYQWALSGMSFIAMGKPLTVVSLKNIRSVLDNKETESWQKLIRVLTHEIMNSLTPIVSLTELLKEKLNPTQPFSAENLPDIQSAIETICRRSSSLVEFVENYRKVAGIPTPVMGVVPVFKLLTDTVSLMQREGEELKIKPFTHHLQIIVDKGLIEQVLINLIKNAFEAKRAEIPLSIEVSAGIDKDGYVFIQIQDNGTGISPEVLERIFIPFFTTKSSGSGIGLSISRQIMHMHRGSLTVYSEQGRGSRFILTFQS